MVSNETQTPVSWEEVHGCDSTLTSTHLDTVQESPEADADVAGTVNIYVPHFVISELRVTVGWDLGGLPSHRWSQGQLSGEGLASSPTKPKSAV